MPAEQQGHEARCSCSALAGLRCADRAKVLLSEMRGSLAAGGLAVLFCAARQFGLMTPVFLHSLRSSPQDRMM